MEIFRPIYVDVEFLLIPVPETLAVMLALAPERPSSSLHASTTYMLQSGGWQQLSPSFVTVFKLEQSGGQR